MTQGNHHHEHYHGFRIQRLAVSDPAAAQADTARASALASSRPQHVAEREHTLRAQRQPCRARPAPGRRRLLWSTSAAEVASSMTSSASSARTAKLLRLAELATPPQALTSSRRAAARGWGSGLGRDQYMACGARPSQVRCPDGFPVQLLGGTPGPAASSRPMPMARRSPHGHVVGLPT